MTVEMTGGAVRRTLILLAVLALCAGSASGTEIQDLVRIKGHERNVLTGMGIVVGLNGTGDTAKSSLVAARPYARLLTNYGNPVVDVEELAKANAFAIVSVTVTVPARGAREGDQLDVSVDKLFNAKSLKGGRLVASLLRVPGPDSPDAQPMAFAEGALLVSDDDPASGTIRGGGQMLRDVRTRVISRGGMMTLVLNPEYAGYPVATTIAEAINEELAVDGYREIARAEDAGNVLIRVPEADLSRPAEFISILMTVRLDPSLIRTPARIVINEKAGIIAVTGNVEVGPVGITHKGMQLTSVTPPADPAFAAGVPAPPEPSRWAGLDTTASGGRSTRLLELLRAFDQLKVPVPDQIAMIYELKRTGALHAEIVHP